MQARSGHGRTPRRAGEDLVDGVEDNAALFHLIVAFD